MGYRGNMATSARHHKEAQTCDVMGCDKESERSFNIKQVSQSELVLKSADIRRVHLCKEHYKAYKKQTQGARAIDATYDDYY